MMGDWAALTGLRGLAWVSDNIDSRVGELGARTMGLVRLSGWTCTLGCEAVSTPKSGSVCVTCSGGVRVEMSGKGLLAKISESALTVVRREIDILVFPIERLLGFDLFEDGRSGVGVELNPDVGLDLGVGVEGADGVLCSNVETEGERCSRSGSGAVGVGSACELDEGRLECSSMSSVP
jgi:hypothetical protein